MKTKNQIILIELTLLFILLGCSTKQDKITISNSFKIQTIKSKDNNISSSLISDSIILVDFGKDIIFHWNNNTSLLIQDSLFENILENIIHNKEYLVSIILDTTTTQANICCDDKLIKIGDFALLLIDEIYNIPYSKYIGNFEHFGYKLNCPYPFDLIVTLNRNRTEVYEKLKENISSIDHDWRVINSLEKEINSTLVSDSIVLVDFGNDIKFYWNNNSSALVKDFLLKKIVHNYRNNKEYILSLLIDTTITPATICVYDKPLRIGDLAFLLLDDIYYIPLATLLCYQFDCVNGDCLRPYGLIEGISSNRKLFLKKIKNYDIMIN